MSKRTRVLRVSPEFYEYAERVRRGMQNNSNKNITMAETTRVIAVAQRPIYISKAELSKKNKFPFSV